jgi:poly-gamma-glutamate capsule biosynthesis protein CapA/YwtB (metallophosphatase superfamily)
MARASSSGSALAPVLVAALCCWAGGPARAAPAQLEIYLEDSHAGTFYHWAQQLDLEQPHTLVLVDAHSDASRMLGSDRLRRQLRRVHSREQRRALLARWRAGGVVQAFGWIEPLMPRPVARVLWIALPHDNKARRAAAARAQLDHTLGSVGRAAGALAPRFRAIDAGELAPRLLGGNPVLVSIDLDAFARLSPRAARRSFSRLWRRVLRLPRLRAVSFAISRSWLRDDAQASRLTLMALEAACECRTARVRFEPHALQGPDRSERAKQYHARGRRPPRFVLARASRELRSFLVAQRRRIRVVHGRGSYRRLLRRWRLGLGDWRLVPQRAFRGADGIWRTRHPGPVRVINRGSPRVATRVRWYVLLPDRPAYNLLPALPAGKVFSGGDHAIVRYRRHLLTETHDGALAARLWRRRLDPDLGAGAVRLSADVRTSRGWVRTPDCEVRAVVNRGFRAGLSEQFGLPYVFGAGLQRDGHLTGPEAGGGNDCANFLVYAWRRQGLRIPWSNPGQLRAYLVPAATGVTLRHRPRPRIPPGSVARGLVVHMGSHVAAVWQDLPPLGRLDAKDLVVHHLGGVPERVTLARLLAGRPDPRFDLLALAPGAPAARLALAGDVNLQGPAAELRSQLDTARRLLGGGDRSADLRLASLEGVAAHEPGGRLTPPGSRRFRFVWPPGRLRWLRAAGIDAVSLGTNHAMDLGRDGLRRTRAHLRRVGIAHFGGLATGGLANGGLANGGLATGGLANGGPASGAVRPWRTTINGLRVAFFGVNFIEGARTAPGVTTLPAHRRALARALEAAADSGDVVVVLPHWGREYTSEVTDRQRRWARWFIHHGAAAVVGSHSHHLQPVDHYQGRPIAYSLGNLVFPGRGPNPGFRARTVLQLALSRHGKALGCTIELRSLDPGGRKERR